MRALLLLTATAAAATAQTWVTETQCVSNCGTSASHSNQSYSSEGGPRIAWGRMSSHATERVKECGSNPLCILMRAAVGYPIALAFDGPYYAVKGVGYGLFYGAVGIGKAGKAIGRGIAYPFRDRPQPPPGSWEAYKHQILRMQKKLAKRDKASRANAKWCKGHVPLSHGPSRAEWEGRCNPGDLISRMSLPPDVRFANAGETSPMGLPKGAADSSARASGDVRPEPQSKADPSAPSAASVVGVAAAATAASSLPPAPSPPTAPMASNSPSSTSQAPTPPIIASDAFAPSPSAEVTPAPVAPAGVPTSLPPSGRPEQRDAAEVLKKTDEVVKDASHGGFDRQEPMLGTKQKEVLAAYNATAERGSQGEADYQTAIAAAGREQAAGSAASPPFHGAAAGGPGGGVDPGPGQSDPITVPSGLAMPARTCVEMVARQLISEEGVIRSEAELFFQALEKGWWGVPCRNRTSTSLCKVRYDAVRRDCSSNPRENRSSPASSQQIFKASPLTWSLRGKPPSSKPPETRF